MWDCGSGANMPKVIQNKYCEVHPVMDIAEQGRSGEDRNAMQLGCQFGGDASNALQTDEYTRNADTYFAAA